MFCFVVKIPCWRWSSSHFLFQGHGCFLQSSSYFYVYILPSTHCFLILIPQTHGNHSEISNECSLFLKSLFTFFFFTEGKGGSKREINNNVWLLSMHPLLGSWPATQACALTGSQTSDPLVYRPAHNPLSHTSQG